MNTLEEIQKILQIVFEDKKLKIGETTVASDIPAWDSLNHMTLINEIEKHFKIQFTFDEVSNFTTVGDIVNCIKKKIY